MGVIDTARGLLTEYSLSNPPANKTTQIDNALTFALGGSRVWFTELTANYVGYVDATYHPSFYLKALANASLRLSPTTNSSTTLDLEGSSAKELTIVSSDSETPTSTPQRITVGLSQNEIRDLNGDVTISLKVSANADVSPGKYLLLVAVSDGLVNQGIYLTLLVSV
jgi:hypothetical protein